MYKIQITLHTLRTGYLLTHYKIMSKTTILHKTYIRTSNLQKNEHNTVFIPRTAFNNSRKTRDKH